MKILSKKNLFFIALSFSPLKVKSNFKSYLKPLVGIGAVIAAGKAYSTFGDGIVYRTLDTISEKGRKRCAKACASCDILISLGAAFCLNSMSKDKSSFKIGASLGFLALSALSLQNLYKRLYKPVKQPTLNENSEPCAIDLLSEEDLKEEPKAEASKIKKALKSIACSGLIAITSPGIGLKWGAIKGTDIAEKYSEKKPKIVKSITKVSGGAVGGVAGTFVGTATGTIYLLSCILSSLKNFAE